MSADDILPRIIHQIVLHESYLAMPITKETGCL
jgi:hypothetical protein